MASDEAAEVAVEGSGLEFRYAGQDQPALAGCSFHIRFGEVYGILGPNGAGKTTLMKMLGTLLAPQAGALRVLGHALPGGERAVRGSLGLAVGESERTFHYRLTCEQNLRYFAAFHPGLAGPRLGRRVREVVEEVGLQERAGHPYSALSQGMKHRLALARALLPSPRLLVVDEPTAGLDVENAAALLATVRRVADAGAAVAFSTHRLGEAATLCDRVLLLRRGQGVAEASPAEVQRLLSDEEVLDVQLDRAPGRALAGLRRIEGVLAVQAAGPRGMRVHCRAGANVPAAALGHLARRGLTVREVRHGGPGLDAAFLRLTGAAP